MSQPHTFEYALVNDEGEVTALKVEFARGTIESAMEARRIFQKLMLSYGFYDHPAPSHIIDNLDEYASAMARTTVDAPWHANSNMEEGEIKARYELFMQQDEDLWIAFRVAARATATPKKTVLKTPKT